MESLLDPNGERLVLDGTWIEDVSAEQAPMTWWIRTAGDCVWGAGTTDEVPVGSPFRVQAFRGRLGSGFAIVGEIASVGPVEAISENLPFYAAVRMEVAFDERGILIREVRDHGDPGPRCIPGTGGQGTAGLCPSLLVLRPAAE